ncbi:low affinity iron permease family protein [Tahibacter amnicola]|uniref:Low affinity iron permease family protein n=1 Tax=Tahibacter amnicola TaxID=2976241 RepID=A0ABY6BET6_9GAMM|nr:low affinity iron permease family protein [Tahibacter amnicola]MCU7376397.1 low affinity iron permease family protein [Paucibacter sp. O1-1]MDA3831414.1 low affinity iron permease family protein [Paucibacter sp. O1-1]UXI68297.1 low affinity iron permease family protein [Tahibacter amnicola]
MSDGIKARVAAVHRGNQRSFFDRLANRVTRVVGSSIAFSLASLSIFIWAVSGPFFNYSQNWQLLVNTTTTIVTFLMVFIIQQSQNKDSVAVHLKLNELLASHKGASNRLVAIEDLDESELEILREFYCRLAELAEKRRALGETHSLDEAHAADEKKHGEAGKSAD